MSKLDKEAVLKDFTNAYKANHGKAPQVEAANGWYSVDGGKNMRLAQLDEWAQELKSGTQSAAAKKPAASKAKKPTSAKPAKNKAAPKKASTSNANGGKTAKELWRERLASQGNERLPRGVR